ncbi:MULTISPECIES: flagellar hook capping FlgD N-terminal domain-containing protein [Shewanella]|uniref:Basal-body rod modification protein FlgD n=1 Tax=Shewanella japonica TaxID=93973 RepID=A0ABN4YD36_9GAMM|nr:MULTISPECIES: flagellar hook capping FlgD N-terminal domain-containing protein [Shewanella]ARD20634.1 flagellar hook capping protein FlgD [Shewanella japonica]KPZ69373.1 Basal-body rod modification protein FlgD [Shewanella sp. P1-14-1]MBQ4890138.1 flagellar biosynthesis protein FlgD [Shewanella sp. MMG014]OBT05318.1 flagellar biosynthesis protein FlgD [Shewanella sp. UCD-FRSSP16_17]
MNVTPSTTSNDPAATATEVMNSPGNDASSIRNEFLTLMIAQIQNQDPTNPIDGTEYVTQLAQFSQVESLEHMRANQATSMVMMENLAIVQSAQLVGKTAMVPASELEIDGLPVDGKVYLGNAVEELSIDIIDENGDVVHTLELGSQEPGDVAFTIDPEALDLPAGEYSIEANITADDVTETADTFIAATIEKVHFVSASGVMMAELGNGLGTVSVLEISEVS